MDSREPVGCSNIHKSILEMLRKVAATNAEVLLVGPTGVGKELYANYVHSHSRRERFKFVPINCGALSNELLENHMFGHVSGAFTGAKIQSDGLLSEAEGGTLFLDEVDSLSIPCQITLLRFLQDKQYRRLGENRLRQANVRIIAATNCDLETAVRERRFRDDLFFRLRVVPVEIPALSRRPEDIVELLHVFTQKASQEYGLPSVEFADTALSRLKNYEWPGNIRELENCVDFVTCLQLQRPIEPHDLPLLKKKLTSSEYETTDLKVLIDLYLSLIADEGDIFQNVKQKLVDSFEKRYIEHAPADHQRQCHCCRADERQEPAGILELMRRNTRFILRTIVWPSRTVTILNCKDQRCHNAADYRILVPFELDPGLNVQWVIPTSRCDQVFEIVGLLRTRSAARRRASIWFSHARAAKADTAWETRPSDRRPIPIRRKKDRTVRQARDTSRQSRSDADLIRMRSRRNLRGICGTTHWHGRASRRAQWRIQ